MELRAALRGDLREILADEERAIARAATRSVRAAAGQARRMIRSQIRRNFADRSGRLSGTPLEDTVRYKSEPRRGTALDATAVVSSRAVYRRRGQEFDLLALYDQGATIRARGGKWLAIPTAEAPLRGGRGGTRRARPSEIKLKLQFVQTAPSQALLLSRGRKPRVLYILVRQVKLTKRLDIARAHGSAAQRLSNEFPRQLAREDRRLEQKWG